MKIAHKTAWLSRAGYLFGALLAGCGGKIASSQPAVEKIERYGDIEVVSHPSAERAHGDWSLRRHGQPLIIDSVGGMWLDEPMRTSQINSLFVVGTGSPPDLLVNVGDPNNASVYHLLRQDGGNLSTPLLCKTFGSDNAVRVIEGAGKGQVLSGPQYQSLAGAVRLMLGSACVYDTVSRQIYAIPRQPDDVYFLYDAKGLLFSPSGRRMARFAMERESKQPLVLVADLEAGSWSRLPVDAERMRYADYAAVDNAWLTHHFEWRTEAGGGERLAERQGFEPLPRRGSFLANAAQYDIPGVTTAQFERLGEFLSRRFGGQWLSDQDSPGTGRLMRYQVEQEEVIVTATGFYIAMTGKPYWPGQPGDPKRQQDLIRRIGAAFDAELAEGRHESMFQAQPTAKP